VVTAPLSKSEFTQALSSFLSAGMPPVRISLMVNGPAAVANRVKPVAAAIIPEFLIKDLLFISYFNYLPLTKHFEIMQIGLPISRFLYKAKFKGKKKDITLMHCSKSS
jgi:hypothetical protein